MATEKEQRRLPLQKVAVRTLSPEWDGRCINNKDMRGTYQDCRNVLQSSEQNSSNREPKLRINEGESSMMKRAGIICEAPPKATKVWVMSFIHVERKIDGSKRRLIT
ncbi:hypothetical protein TRVL_04471 [Trypanosoma vivax]|nr:hypothetical protein TRVL_04471 [Trypanosoma vivax]